jgi:hypothetical protein
VDLPAGGLAIAAVDLVYEPPRLSLRLLVTARFGRRFVGSFQVFKAALVCLIEDAEQGACAAFKLIDPHKTYPRRTGPNYHGQPPAAALEGFQTSWVTVPLEVTVPRPHRPPSLFVTVVLAEHRSNTLAIDAERGAVASYREGVLLPSPAPADPLPEDPDDEP